VVGIQARLSPYQANYILNGPAGAANEMMVPPFRKFVKGAAGPDVRKRKQAMTQQGPHHAINRGAGQRSPLNLKLGDEIICGVVSAQIPQ